MKSENQMEKINFNRWIPLQYHPKDEKGVRKVVENTGYRETDFPSPGIFHGWGIDEGTTVAIAQHESGTVELVPIDHVKFVQEETTN